MGTIQDNKNIHLILRHPVRILNISNPIPEYAIEDESIDGVTHNFYWSFDQQHGHKK